MVEEVGAALEVVDARHGLVGDDLLLRNRMDDVTTIQPMGLDIGMVGRVGGEGNESTVHPLGRLDEMVHVEAHQLVAVADEQRFVGDVVAATQDRVYCSLGFGGQAHA